VPIGTERLRLIIDAQDRASTALKSVDRSVGGLRQSINTLIGLAGIGGGLAGLGVALRKALDVGEAGAQLANLERSFTRFAESTGANADQVLANMQRMSSGMMAQSELMEQYNRSFLLMGQDMAAQMPRLMQIAAAASAAGMGDFNFMLNSLVTGLGRLSPLILDNLGFTIKASEAYERYAQSIGKSAAELSKAEQQMALLNVVTEQAENRFGDLDEAAQRMSGMGIAQLRAAFRDLADQMKQDVAPTIDAAAGQIATVLRSQIRETDEWVQAQTGQLTSLLYAGINLQRVWREIQGQGLGETANIQAMMRLAETMDLSRLSAEQWTQMYSEVSRHSIEAAEALATLRQQQLLVVREQQHMINTARRLQSVETTYVRQVSAQNEVLARLARQYRIGRRDVDQYGGSLTRLARIMSITAKSGVDLLEVITEVNEKVRVTGHVWQGAKPHGFGEQIDDVTASVDKLGESLESTLESLLSFTRPFDMTKYLDETGQHIDTWDENLSRAEALLGDTAKAMQEPWFPEWAEMTGLPEGMVDPAQVKQFAVDFIDAFQRFDPSTWGAIKWDALTRSYERALSTDVNFQALLDYAQDQMELAGLGPESELVQKAFGFDTAGAGSTAAQDYGTTFGETLVAVLPAEGERGIKAYKSGLLAGADDPNFRDELRKKLMPEARSIVVDVVREMLGSGAIP